MPVVASAHAGRQGVTHSLEVPPKLGVRFNRQPLVRFGTSLALGEVENAGPVEAIILDLDAVAFMDSSGLTALHTILLASEERRIPLTLSEVPEHVRQVLDLTRMAGMFQCAD